MDTLTKAALEERLTLLVGGQFAELRALTRAHDDQQDRQLHEWLAEADLQEIDLLERFERWLPVNQYAACQTLLPALGLSSRADATRLEQLLRMVHERNDSRANYISEALQVRFASQPSLPLELAARFDSDLPLSKTAYWVWGTSFATAQPAAAAQFVVDWLGPSSGDLSAVQALVTAIPWRSSEVRTVIAPHHQPLLEWLRDGLLETNAEGAWYCLVEFGQFYADAYAIVADALEQGVSVAASNVARSLFRNDGTTYGVNDVPLADVLQSLVTLACADASLCNNVDLALSCCLRKQNQQLIAIDCLRRLGDGPDDTLERFDATFHALRDDAPLFKKILTGWLLSQTASFKVIGAMLNLVSSNRAIAGMDEELFARATPLARTKVVRRILGLHSDGETLCHFAADIAKTVSLGDAGLELSNQMFNLLKDEFPHATEGFLKPLAASARRRERGAPIFRGVYATVLAWKRHLKRLPRRRELHIGDADAMALRSARIKQQAEIRRGAEAMSVFATVMSKVHVAQGHRFTSHMEDGPMAISDMGHFSHSFELPSSELSDPMRGLIHRMQMRENSR